MILHLPTCLTWSSITPCLSTVTPLTVCAQNLNVCHPTPLLRWSFCLECPICHFLAAGPLPISLFSWLILPFILQDWTQISSSLGHLPWLLCADLALTIICWIVVGDRVSLTLWGQGLFSQDKVWKIKNPHRFCAKLAIFLEPYLLTSTLAQIYFLLLCVPKALGNYFIPKQWL